MGQSRPHDNQRQTEREREKKKENNHKGKGSGRGRERVQNSYSETTQKRRRKNKDRNYERGRRVFFAGQILKNALGSLLSYSLFFYRFLFLFSPSCVLRLCVLRFFTIAVLFACYSLSVTAQPKKNKLQVGRENTTGVEEAKFRQKKSQGVKTK